MPKKDPLQISLFPEQVYEYLILISPSDEVIQHVDVLKAQLNEVIDIGAANLKSVAHITLFTYEAYESVNVKELMLRSGGLNNFGSFTIKISGYKIFESGDSRSLVLDIQDTENIDYLAAVLNPKKKRKPKRPIRQTSILDVEVKKPATIHPHITIARNIPANDIAKVEDFTPFDFKGEFFCDRIQILKRPLGSAKHFSPAGQIKLG